MTGRELRQLLGTPLAKPLPEPPEMDEKAREFALKQVAELSQEVQKLEQRLATLGGFFSDDALPAALIGAMGICANELHSQIPALREAMKEAGK